MIIAGRTDEYAAAIVSVSQNNVRINLRKKTANTGK